MIKYLVMDVDGSLTDGKIYMGSEGEAMKAFSIKDGYVVNYILKPANIVPIIITARTSKIVQNRCNELGITQVHQGKFDKLTALIEIVGEKNIGKCAYFGDDIIDLKCMNPIKEAGGIIGCPADAVQEIKGIADYSCVNKAGEGALREFVEWLVNPRIDNEKLKQRVDYALNYLLNLDIAEVDGGKQVVNDNFFYSVQSYMTKSAEECKFESHREFIDIQIIISGSEAMDIADISRLTVKEDYNSDKDIMFWEVPNRMVSTTLREGDYIILYPENAHRGARMMELETQVIKVVGKVRIN